MDNTILINAIIRFVESHVKEEIDYKDIEKAMGLSHRYFREQFRQYAKMLLKQYINVRKIAILFWRKEEVDYMDYISVKAASEKWGISERRIQNLCEENRIVGTEKFGRAWMIPKDDQKPIDGRRKESKHE